DPDPLSIQRPRTALARTTAEPRSSVSRAGQEDTAASTRSLEIPCGKQLRRSACRRTFSSWVVSKLLRSLGNDDGARNIADAVFALGLGQTASMTVACIR
ncbi:MAG: hypothetical protein AB7I09_07385, partial [Planctomycetota bacterium]